MPLKGSSIDVCLGNTRLIRNFVLGYKLIATAANPHQTGGEKGGQGKICTTVNTKILTTYQHFDLRCNVQASQP